MRRELSTLESLRAANVTPACRMRLENYCDYILAIYRKAENAGEWPQLLASLGEILQSPVVTVLGVDKVHRRATFLLSNLDGVSPAANPAGNEAISDLVQSAIDLDETGIEAGVLTISRDASKDCQLLKHIQALGLQKFVAATLIESQASKTAIFFHQASPSRGPTKRFSKTFELLRPHLAQALRIGDRMLGLEADLANLRRVLDRSPHGVVILDETLRILLANAEGERITSARDGLAKRGGRLTSTSRESLDDLERIAKAGPRTTTSSRGFQAFHTLTIAKPSGKRPLIVQATRYVGSDHLPTSHRPALILFLQDLDYRPAAAIDAFARAFKLTPAEEKLVSALVSGATLRSHAGVESVSEETARWHLKNVFSKTDCHSQTELLSLIQRSIITE